MVRVLIDNLEEDKKLNFDLEKAIENAVNSACAELGLNEPAEVSVLICDDEMIRELNSKYRGIDRETDVLSFPMLDFEKGKPLEKIEGDLVLGDIVISLPRAMEQAERYGHSLKREISFLTVHSMLHLFGFDHIDENEGEEMRAWEKRILTKMGIGRDEE